MFPTASLTALALSFFLLSSDVLAAPRSRDALSTLAFSTHLNTRGEYFKSVLESDQAHAKALMDHAHSRHSHSKRSSSISVTNTVTTYTATVGVGSPATNYTLLIDTGSSNTWVGAGKAYVKTSTSHSTGHPISVSYGSGSFSGTEYNDTVSLSPALTVTNQGLGVATNASGFYNVDGILGVGPVDLTQQTVSGVTRGYQVPTITDSLVKQGKISTEVLGIYYAPTTKPSNRNGELTFGGVDTSKTTSAVSYVNITKTYPADAYWGVNQTLTYGSSTILPNSAGIMDTGTTLILLATQAFDAYKSATGAVEDANSGLLKITSAQYAALKPLNFKIGSNTWTLSPNGQIWPRSLNTAIGGTSSGIYLVVNDLGSSEGQGLDFINGYTFLERFYSVFDTTHSRVGLATTAQTTSTSN